MKIDWTPLTDELALWRSAGLALPIWWRDDDAVADTPALARLVALAEEIDMDVHLAIIPDLIEPSLAPATDSARVVPVVHGWRHVSHAPQGAKNAEFGHLRPSSALELTQGLAHLRGQFGTRSLPLFVPPWNRISAECVALLPAAGYRGLSTYGARGSSWAANGVTQLNTHLDPIFWRGHRGLVDPDVLLNGLAATLRDRREGRTDVQEPLGLLTHHLVHTDEVWRFCGDVLRVLLDAGAHPAHVDALL